MITSIDFIPFFNTWYKNSPVFFGTFSCRFYKDTDGPYTNRKKEKSRAIVQRPSSVDADALGDTITVPGALLDPSQPFQPSLINRRGLRRPLDLSFCRPPKPCQRPSSVDADALLLLDRHRLHPSKPSTPKLTPQPTPTSKNGRGGRRRRDGSGEG